MLQFNLVTTEMQVLIKLNKAYLYSAYFIWSNKSSSHLRHQNGSSLQIYRVIKMNAF